MLVREALYRWAFNPLADLAEASDDIKEALSLARAGIV